ncbi:MAG: AIR synthase related protein [Candidatus Woesearchaeota archaeon]
MTEETEKKEKTEDYEKREAKAVADGKSNMSRELFSRKVGRGSLFAEVRENPSIYPDHYMLRAIDGVGTKLFLSQWLDRYDTIGQDLVAMSVNDLATFGRVELDTMDVYFAVQAAIENEKMGQIMKGIDCALMQCRKTPKVPINYGKLETASLDEMITGPVPGYGYDISGTVTAFIRKNDVPSFEPEQGDVIVGFASSGLHSNGFTAARHMLLHPDVEPREEWKSEYTGKFWLEDAAPCGKTIGELLLTPTLLYFSTTYKIAQEIPGTYGVNITGYGLKNFNRFGEGIKYLIHHAMEPHPIHALIMREGGYDVKKAYTKMNMGMGFAMIVKDYDQASRVIRIASEEGHRAKVVGHIEASDEQTPSVILDSRLHSLNMKVEETFEGYD